MNKTRPSMRAAINAMCRECIVDDRRGNGNWRQQVAACTAPACPLYPLRPVSHPQQGKVGRRAVKALFVPVGARTMVGAA